ncbi:hypothetical protein NC653_032888 [Populus alba x Populus x berolinensis]|uniref:Uncharacterized protein n=1 Tax=Populus alba x Populus x berolinensis TaxID=444605 RepID=A0AAD6LSB9_9ROSI|nr:hypothetical protein NC653_032888 [Populus alba x Populus x berolinensis]
MKFTRFPKCVHAVTMLNEEERAMFEDHRVINVSLSLYSSNSHC